MDQFKSYGVGDWLKVVANIAGSAAAGYAAGGYAGIAIAVISNLAALFQAKPGNFSVPK